ncbi:bifunctional hydroxymethylpyrimidine kinase/phosphomethylpyrimidine kinase [Nocardiopsis sp. HNM0947]|uniref:Bifunctional hydroxymethylpyrimidine kinase/phosphomethylpyrimidine kinase n=1 Tax=Nocardiopsis coralli TaxID=2772213 RepID=A0ABR9PD44_9ACTN|nr:PfkB family carbohydrate kinase [Nocardiopsis coralli]MBE3001734.1 bifunctional hydroxymethylpyrimidine kinase/phosphomethylpyrimidine kinase [Nocardiopsis coralli]
MNGRLIHVSPVIIDLVMTVDRLPEPGGDTLADSAVALPGGGFNVMAAAARAGMPVVYGGAHGTGPNGELARAALRAEGVEAVHDPLPGSDTGFCVALVDSGAERTFVTSLGAESELPATALRSLDPGPGDTVYAVGYSLLPGPRAEDLAAWIVGLDPQVRVALDPAPVVGAIDPELLAKVMERVDVFSPNATEAAALTGGAGPERAAADLASRVRPGGAAVVRDGVDGCVVAVADREPVRVPGVPVAAVDTNGAGDSHVGALLAALAEGLDLEGAARRANAAAARAVTLRGPATAPTRAELAAFAEENRITGV